MNFCVIVKITKKNICIHYQIENGDVEVLTADGMAEIPMAFCLNGGELLMNRFASEQARMKATNAYSDYFELIKNPYRNFRFAGEDKPIKQLLYYGLETHFSAFLREKVYDNSPIESLREGFPIRFLFADDISSEERQFVIELFKEQGYKNVAEVRILKQVFEELLPRYTGPIITLSGINGDLYVSYFADANAKATRSKCMKGLGKDHRLSACTDLMLEYINERYYYPFPEKEGVEDILLKEAVRQYQDEGVPMLYGSIVGPDGETYEYEVNRRDIEQRQRSLQSSSSIITEVKHYLNQSGGSSQNVAVVLLDDVNSTYFNDMLRKGFGQVVGANKYQYKKIWEEVFKHTDFSVPDPIRDFCSVSAPAVPPPPPSNGGVGKPPLPPPPSIRGGGEPSLPSHPPKTATPPSVPPAPKTPPPIPPVAKKKSLTVPPPPPAPKRTVVPAPPNSNSQRGKSAEGKVEMIVGREGEQKWAITEKTVSRKHCKITRLDDGTYLVEDLSKNGTFINDVRVDGKGKAKATDRIGLGANFVVELKDLIS